VRSPCTAGRPAGAVTGSPTSRSARRSTGAFRSTSPNSSSPGATSTSGGSAARGPSIADIARTQIGALSGGQQQRALLARTLIQRGDLLLLDEPLGAVDVETRKLVAEILAELRAEGRTIVVATHDFGPGSEGFDEVVSLHEGRRVEVPAERLAEMGHSHLPPGTT